MKTIRSAAALTLAALAVPAAAAAHPSVYTDTATVEQSPGVFGPQTRYVVSNHGFTMVLRETNGLGAPRGVVTYTRLPGAYRRTIPVSQWLSEGGTGAQAHATCATPALESEAAILAWQGGGDPFYNYVPFQRAAAGLEDDPAAWLGVVKERTGVDLATADPRTACEGLGGTYRDADEVQTTATALAAGTVAPLDQRIATLTGALTDAGKATAALQAALDAARAELARLATPLTVALPSARIARRSLRRGVDVAVSGPANAGVKVTLTVARPRALGLRSSVLARATTTLHADGKATVALRARKRLARPRRPVALTLTVRAGDRSTSTTATLTR